jgi:hypothetical protein
LPPKAQVGAGVGERNDANACTTDSRDAGVCHNIAPEAASRVTSVDCGDANGCTTDS